MGFWRNVNLISCTLIALIFSFCISTSIYHNTLFVVQAQSVDIPSHQGKYHDLETNAQNMAKKYRDARGEKVPNQYIVVLKDDDILSSTNSPAVEAMKQGAGLRHIFDHSLHGFAMKVPNDKVLQAVMKIPEVDYVQPDIKVTAFAQSLPNGIDRADGDLSSTKSGDGSGVVDVDIGIMDTGIDLNHPDLNVFRQVSFISGTSSGNDDNGHGTAVAGVAAAKDNSQGVVGVSPGARLWAIKVLDSNGIGFMSDLIEGIDYVTQHAKEIEVVNLSFGGDGSSDAFHTAIIRSVSAGVTYVVAAGNEAKDASSVIPASFPEVIAVSAIVDTDGKCGAKSSISTTAGKDDTFASFSNYGSVIDIAAPGVLIKTTTKGDSYSSFTGTSAATPHVTGAAALYKSEHPEATSSDVRSALRSLGSSPATTCDGNGHGYFTGDRDNNAEPLLYIGKSSSSPLPSQTSCTANLPVKSDVTANGNDAGYPPTNVLDNNRSTRWSNLGIGSWIRTDLGSTKNICSIDIAWLKGNERRYNFVIATSTDGTTFTTKFTGTSSGTTLNSERYFFSSTNARYVKVTVNGNTVNNYAHITELDIFGPSLPSTSCTTNLPVSRVTANGNDAGYPPTNVLDNNRSTRWSNLGIGSWIRTDLGSTKNICSIDIAWLKGNERRYNFVIATSTDGTTFTTKFTGTSSGTTLNSERYFFSSTNARYVKVTVNGNTVNNYAHIAELDIFGPSVGSLSFTSNLTYSGYTS
jgi:subtilisin